MQKYNIMLVVVFAMMLAGCGGSDDGGSAPATPSQAAAPSGSPAPASPTEPASSAGAGKAAPMAAGDKTMYVDHSKDEMEFQLKHSIDGWQSLLEDVSDSDEVAKIKEHIAALQAKLDKL